MHLFKFGAVVVAEGHNPTILHPSFLKSQKIVAEDWELAQDPISTPPFANVVFKNGISLLAEQSKLQVNADGEDVSRDVKLTAAVARRYVAELPHVHYTAVGLNFTSFIERDNAAEFLIGRFVKPGPWNKGRLTISNVKQQFSYDFENHKLNLSLDTGAKTDDTTGEPQTGIVVHANYHQNCNGADEAVSALNKAREYHEDYLQTVKTVLEE